MYITHRGVLAQHGLQAKRGCLNVEVVEWPRAGGGRSSSSGHQDERLLMEAEYAKLIGDKV